MPPIKDILKNRWPEALLVIGFQAIAIALADVVLSTMQDKNALQMSDTALFVISFASGIFWVLWMLLRLGFLYTASEHGSENFDPSALIVNARPFFWRMIRFEIVLGIAMVIVTILLMAVLTVITGAAGPEFIQKSYVQQGLFMLATLILIKPALLMPAIMIVCNNMVIESMFALRDYRLSRCKGLIAVFFILLTGSFLLSRFMETASRTAAENILLAVHAVFTAIMTLLMGLFAVKFVSDQVSPHDTASPNLNHQSQTPPHANDQTDNQNHPPSHPEQ